MAIIWCQRRQGSILKLPCYAQLMWQTIMHSCLPRQQHSQRGPSFHCSPTRHRRERERATSHTRLRARDPYTSLVGKVEPVQVRFTLRLRDRQSMWMHDGCKVYMNSYMASHGSRFMVTWVVFKNHLLEVGLTRNRETMALQTLTSDDVFYFIMCEDPRESKVIEIACGWGPGHMWLHTTLEDLWPHYMIVEVCCDGGL